MVMPLPSMIWRQATVWGVETGYAAEDITLDYAAGPFHMLAVELPLMVVGLLCFALSRSWEPRVGGRRLPQRPILAVGLLGAAVLAAGVVTFLLSFIGSWLCLTAAWTPDAGMTAPQRTAWALAYAPLALWPAAIVVTMLGWYSRVRPRPTHRR